MGWSVTCDFDGTITLTDTVNALLQDFAIPEWLDLEAQWIAGAIGSRECLAEQTKLLRLPPETLDETLDAVEVDPDVVGFFSDCARLGLPVSVVSDGYDWAVRRVLTRLGLREIPVVANRLVHLGGDRWSVLFPFTEPACGFGVCKCAASSSRRQRLHVGDGRSDFCIADDVDLVFAKGALLDQRRARGEPSVPFERFAELRRFLPNLEGLVVLGSRPAAQRTG
jgi:2,3-diketo-5-methylthio-1-phosphopentane phosphatase